MYNIYVYILCIYNIYTLISIIIIIIITIRYYLSINFVVRTIRTTKNFLILVSFRYPMYFYINILNKINDNDND